MKLNKLSLKHKNIFHEYLSLNRRDLSVYAFENIYIWKGLFEIEWALIRDSLCIFFKDKFGAFLYLPPLAKENDPEVSKEAFSILDKFNKNKEMSRIENIEEKDVSFYEESGFNCLKKSDDYLCLREDLAKLRGDRFKSKRACLNYFTKHHDFEYAPFSLKFKDDCLGLYNAWMQERKTGNQDHIYQGMLKDSRNSLKIALRDYAHLDFTGMIVKVSKKIRAFTIGFKLNKDTFCILYEIADLSVKGITQFVFARFCSELKDYRYINIMDDSGLKNLKKVKLSYHPVKLIPAYIASRKNA